MIMKSEMVLALAKKSKAKPNLKRYNRDYLFWRRNTFGFEVPDEINLQFMKQAGKTQKSHRSQS
jgi:hypothetical protein